MHKGVSIYLSINMQVMVHFIQEGLDITAKNYFHSRGLVITDTANRLPILQEALGLQEWYSSKLNQRPTRSLAIKRVFATIDLDDQPITVSPLSDLFCVFSVEQWWQTTEKGEKDCFTKMHNQHASEAVSSSYVWTYVCRICSGLAVCAWSHAAHSHHLTYWLNQVLWQPLVLSVEYYRTPCA